jgi:hypothetical protein
MTGAAIAANTKIKVFSAAGIGRCRNPSADGMAIFKVRFDPIMQVSGIEMHLHVQDLEPNTEHQAILWLPGENYLRHYDRASEGSRRTPRERDYRGVLSLPDAAGTGTNPTVQIFTNSQQTQW